MIHILNEFSVLTNKIMLVLSKESVKTLMLFIVARIWKITWKTKEENYLKRGDAERLYVYLLSISTM